MVQDLDPRGGIALFSLVPLFLMLFLYLIAVPGYRVMTRNISLNGTTLGDHAFESTLKVWTVLWIYVSFEPNRWQGLFLQSFCISTIHGGQMNVTIPVRPRNDAPPRA